MVDKLSTELSDTLAKRFLRVAIVGSAVGLKGEVRLQVTTDIPAKRFVKGAKFRAVSAKEYDLTIDAIRFQGGKYIARFAEVSDRIAAENLRGVELYVDTVPDRFVENEFFYYELQGLEVHLLETDEVIGKISAFLPRPGQDLLEVQGAEKYQGQVLYIPFVEQIVPEVDTDLGVVKITPPAGLLEINCETN